MVATAARTILESLDRLPDDDGRAKICLIGIDTVLHFFTLTVRPTCSLSLCLSLIGVQPGSTEPSMLVIGDLEDIFLPKPNDLLINLAECRAGVESLLGRLNDMFKDNHTVGSALGAALQAAYKLVVRSSGRLSRTS